MQNRRETLKQSAVVAGLLATAGFPQFAYAAFNKAAFDAKSVQDSAKAAGALGASTALPGVKHLMIMVEKNPSSLVAMFHVTDAVEANFSTRAKMGQSSDVYAVAIMNDGKALWAKKEVKVTLGGCGG